MKTQIAKFWILVLTVAFSFLAQSDDSTYVTYEEAVEVFSSNKCLNCHGALEKKAPKYRYIKNMVLRFDLKRNGQLQRPGPRMSGVRIKGDGPLILKNWILSGAPNYEGEATLSEERVRKLIPVN